MASAPRWKVYGADGEYKAACKDGEAAAALAALYGDDGTIRDGHSRVVWAEGKESIPAAESYDTVAETIRARAAR